jgi:hypothetical protein
MAAKTYSDRVMRFRRGVYAARRHLTPGCLLLLLRLSDDMSANCIVSVPRSTLAEDVDAPTSRITEWIAEARAAGFLDVVRRARPKVTAVYQGLYVAPQRYAPADLRGTPPADLRGTPPVPSEEVRPSGPQNGGSEVRPAPTPRGTDPAQRTDNLTHLVRRGSDEESA